VTELRAALRRVVAQRFTAVDLATLLYVAIATGAVLAFSGGDHADWTWLLTAHALLVALVLLAPTARTAGPVGRFLGDWYPIFLLLGLYAEVGVVNLDLGFQHDQTIQRLEQWMFGSQVSYRWIREWPNALFSWVMHGCYLAYYAILCASPLGLWLSGRRDAARRTIFGVMAAFYVCYVVFLFFPVAGPPSGRPEPPSGCSTAATRGAPRFRRRTWPPPWWPRCARSATGARWGSCSRRSRSAWSSRSCTGNSTTRWTRWRA